MSDNHREKGAQRPRATERRRLYGAPAKALSESETAASEKKLGRLQKRPDFLCVREKGRKWVAPTMTVQVMENGLDQSRLGLIVTKKLGNAVVRNRIKRRLRAVATECVDSSGLDIVILGRQATATEPYEKLKKDFKWCLKKLLNGS